VVKARTIMTALLLMLAVLSPMTSMGVNAQTEDELRAQIAELEARIAELEAMLTPIAVVEIEGAGVQITAEPFTLAPDTYRVTTTCDSGEWWDMDAYLPKDDDMKILTYGTEREIETVWIVREQAVVFLDVGCEGAWSASIAPLLGETSGA
jgi:hypothetical protein